MNHHPDLRFVLSCFVTHDRPLIQGNRFDQFLATLKSYEKIRFKSAHLFITLDGDIEHRWPELENMARLVFRDCDFEIHDQRITSRVDWQNFFAGKLGNNDVWWFSQNDDHPFVCNDLNYFLKLLQELKDEDTPSSIYLSHWPEMLSLSSKLGGKIKSETCVQFEGTLLDAIQIFNEPLIEKIFWNIEWRRSIINRIDTLAISKNINPSAESVDINHQLIKVPLMEICRKFIGYAHVNLEYDAALTTVPHVLDFEYDQAELIRYVSAPHNSAWHSGRSHPVDQSYLDKILELATDGSQNIPVLNPRYSFMQRCKNNFYILQNYKKKIKRLVRRIFIR